MNAILLLGGNQGKVKESLSNAIELLSAKLGKPIRSSNLYESEPWGFEARQNFINQVVEFKSNLNPFELLSYTQSIEKKLGRQEKAGTQYESRPIDIDILFCDDLILQSQRLTIPHPLLHKRRFTLLPLMDHWSNLFHPVLKNNIEQLLKKCEDNCPVRKID